MDEINVALMGFGNVGRAFADYIRRRDGSGHAAIRIRAVADSSGGIFIEGESDLARLIEHKRAGGSIGNFSRELPAAEPERFISSLRAAGVTILVESLPTNLENGEPALGLLLSALRRGIGVVTVDKGPLVHGFRALAEAAREAGARIGYTGTTGVRVPPAIEGRKVLEIRGVLNGTTNYILTAMQERSLSFREALADTQAAGIAEPDPRLDVEGWDTASKILILAQKLMNAESTLAEVSRIGIGPETESLIATGRESGRVVRLVGRARIHQGRVRVSVAPKLLAHDSPFYSIRGTSKAAAFRAEDGSAHLALAVSGRDAISQVILEDILEIARSAAAR